MARLSERVVRGTLVTMGRRTAGALAVVALLASACGAKTGLLVAQSMRDAGAGGGMTSRDAGGWMDGARVADGEAGARDGAAESGAPLRDGAVVRVDGSSTVLDGAADVLGPVAGVAAGAEHTCVWRTTGQVQCWGRNDFGQAGTSASTPTVTAPVFVPGVRAVQMALGSRHTCALDADGAVACWGLNTWGMLGTAEPDQTERPQRVPGLPPIARLTAGWSHTCALAVGGEVYCWGKNDGGQIGIGTTADQHRPVRVASLDTAVDVTAGRSHTCAVTVDGVVYCWGGNAAGQLGFGTDGIAVLPLAVPGLGPMVVVRAGEASTCAVGSDGRLQCWGALGRTLLYCALPCPIGPCGGDGGTDDAHPFVAFAGHVDAIEVGRAHGCLVDATRALRCWGDSDRRQLGFRPTVNCDGSSCSGYGSCPFAPPTAVDGITSVASMAVGYDHSCAVDDRHFVYCWGDNTRAQTGSAGDVVSVPTRVMGI